MNRLIASGSLVIALLSACGGHDTNAKEEPGRDVWVTSDRLNRRTCPNTGCGVVGVLFFREKTTIYEERDGWGRVSRYYDASCRDGRSEYVDDGNAHCEPENGVVDGRFAEWVSLKHVASTQPSDPAANATGDYALIRGSDDYGIYNDVFARAAANLVIEGRCSRADFEEMGGWMKSSNHRDRPIYFTYCGGMTISNRIYLDASTGRVFR